MNQALLDLVGFLGGSVAVLVDRRHAVLIASVAVALALSPTAAGFGGGSAALLLGGAAVAAGLLGALARWGGRHTRGGAGLDPLVPVFSPRRELFGPRSLRLLTAALAIPAASWISYNVPVGLVVTVRGLLFPVAFVWVCGAVRLLLARTIEDLAVGVAVIALAGACGWVVRGGVDPLPGAAAVVALVPLASMLAEFLGGRRAATVAANDPAVEPSR